MRTLAILVCAVAGMTRAQPHDTRRTITGTVTDARSGAPVAHTKISLIPKKSGLMAVYYAILKPTAPVPTVLVRGKARTTASRMRRQRALGFNCSAVDLM